MGKASLAEVIPLHCNIADAVIYDHVASAIRSGLPILSEVDAHQGHAVLVGGGPSLLEKLDDVRARADQGQHIFALNGSARFLTERGIIPYAVILLDGRAENRRFVEDLPATTRYFIASQCHPDVFEVLKGRDVTVWHPNLNGRSGVVEKRPTVLIGGGTSVGIRAMRVVHVLGYRNLHLYGYDSSYRDCEGHAYPQPENDGELIYECRVGEKLFHASPWMIRQADDFQHVVADLSEDGTVITVAGDGLLPAVAHRLMRGIPNDVAIYDLSDSPSSFDFTTWLVLAEMEYAERGRTGPLRVRFIEGPKDGFRNDLLPQSSASRRLIFENVIRPALALTGAVEERESFDGHRCAYTMRPVVERARAGEAVPRFCAPQVARQHIEAELGHIPNKVTLTLREASYHPDRNSRTEDWLGLARVIKADGFNPVIVRDTGKRLDPDLDPDITHCPSASKDILIRMALYEAASANLFTCNGPANLAYFSAVPWLVFRPASDNVAATPAWWANQIGIPVGSQYPWAAETQRLVWNEGTLDQMIEAWRALVPLLHEPMERRHGRA